MTKNTNTLIVHSSTLELYLENTEIKEEMSQIKSRVLVHVRIISNNISQLLKDFSLSWVNIERFQMRRIHKIK